MKKITLPDPTAGLLPLKKSEVIKLLLKHICKHGDGPFHCSVYHKDGTVQNAALGGKRANDLRCMKAPWMG